MKVVVSAGKRKTSIAKATIKEGSGKIRINSFPLDVYQPKIARMKIMEPLLIAKDYIQNLDIRIRVSGGGFMSQAEAARMAIALGLVKWTDDYDLKKMFIEYDRTMIVGDPRQTEPKRFGGPSARSRYQKSYR